jgi:glycosyltransferase involved in cell wall biosynthesis
VAEKRAHLVPLALRELRRDDPSWRGLVFGDGEERARIATLVEAEGLAGALSMPGFVPWEELSSAMLSARCLLLPTVREGFGLVVLEAAAHGLPAVVVAEPDNAATELIAPGENGLVCRSADPAELAGAVRELAADAGIHARTRTWFERARARYSVEAAAAEHRALHERLRA